DVQVIRAGAIEVNPTLDDRAYWLPSIDCYCHCSRAVGGHGHASWDGDPIIAGVQGSSVVDKRDGSSERTRGKLCLRDTERLFAASGIIQCDSKRRRMTNGYTAETRRNGIHPCCRISG